VGYIPLFVSGMWSEAGERQALDALMARRVDGVIVLAGCLGNEALVGVRATPAHGRGGPCRSVRRACSAWPSTTALARAWPHSTCWMQATGALRTSRAIWPRKMGHSAWPAIAKRWRQQAWPGTPDLVVEGNFTEASGQRAVQHLLDSGLDFSAIFAANDQMAIGAALALYRRGLRVPDDVSLVGFDDLAPAQYAIPPLTTIRQSVYQMGRQAAAAVLDLLNGRTPHANLPQPQLVLRESTRPLHA
jgi:LacI family transcriptional regulator